MLPCGIDPISCVPLPVWSWSRPRCRTERHYWRLPPATARLPTHMAGPVACLDSLRSLNSRTPLLSGSRECVQATQAGDAKHPQCISPGRHLSTRLIGSIKADPMTVLQPHEVGSCALISVQDGQRRVRHLLAASRGCPPRTHAAAPSGCIGRLWVPQDYSSRGRALERRRYTCADVARVKWLLVQGRRQVVGLSVVSACSRECSTVCDSHGCSWVGHGAGGRSGAPQQPPRLTPIQFGTYTYLHPDRGTPTSTGHISGGLAPQELILGGLGESWGCTGRW